MRKLSTPAFALLFTLCLTSAGMAQTSSDSIRPKAFIIDLGKPMPRTLQNKRYDLLQADTRELISFQLINGNPFKYNYVINSNMVNLFENSTTDPIGDQFKKTLDLAKEVENKSSAGDDQTKKLKDAEDAFKAAAAERDNLKAELAAKSQPVYKKMYVNASKEINGLAVKVAAAQQRINDNKNEQDRIKEKISDNYKKANAGVNEKILRDAFFSSSITTLKVMPVTDSAGDRQSTTKNLINSALVMLFKVDELLNEAEDYKTQLTHEDFLDKNYATRKENFMAAFRTLKEKKQELTSNIEIAEISTPKLNTLVKNITDKMSAVKVICATLANVQMNYYTLPHDVNGKNIDLLKMTIERRDKVTNALLSKNDYQIWIKGGLKIDISAGVFLTTLKDDKYFTVDSVNAAGDTFKKIYKSNQGKYGLGFGSMLNISYRTGAAWIKPALSVGAMVSEAQKFQGLAGLSLTLGKEERAVIHWGLSFGSINKLENSYETFDRSKKVYSLGESNQVPIAQRFTFGHFFGFTYNITGTKAKVPSITAANGQ